jgi:hypothetical protein
VTGLERARELRRFRDELDALAAAQVERLWPACENVGDAAHAFASRTVRADVIEEKIAEIALLDEWRQELNEWRESHLGPWREEYIDLAVEVEVGPDVLVLLNAARDAVRSELASVLPGLTRHERDVFEKTAARSGQR